MWTTWGRTTCNMFGFAKGWTPRKFGTTPWTNSGLGWFLSKQIWTYSISLLDILIHGGMMVINWALCHWVSARPCLNRITLDGTGFWEGWVSKRWQLLQQQFYATICSHCTGRWWVVSLITKLWEVAWDLWEHRNGILLGQETGLSREEERGTQWDVCWSFNDLLGRSLLPRDRHLLKVSLSTLQKKDLVYKGDLICQVMTVLQANDNGLWRRRMQANRMLQGMQLVMRHWTYRRHSA
jgi:hypothetical protein